MLSVYDGSGGCWGNSSNVYGCFHHYEGCLAAHIV